MEERFVSKIEHDSAHGNLERRVSVLEAQMQTIRAELQDLQVDKAKLEEQMKAVLLALDEIKTLISSMVSELKTKLTKIEEELDKVKSRPMRIWDGMVITLLGLLLGIILRSLMQLH